MRAAIYDRFSTVFAMGNSCHAESPKHRNHIQSGTCKNCLSPSFSTHAWSCCALCLLSSAATASCTSCGRSSWRSSDTRRPIITACTLRSLFLMCGANVFLNVLLEESWRVISFQHHNVCLPVLMFIL